MKELRLTFRADDFGAVSQILVDMGIGFRVEPIEGPAAEAAPAHASHPPATRRRRSAKKTRKPGSPAKAAGVESSARGDVPASGVNRLRAAIAQNRTTGERARFAPPERATEEEDAEIGAPPDEQDR